MFQRILVVYCESLESRRTLTSAIQLAKGLRAELHAVFTMHDFPAYTAYAMAADPSFVRGLDDDRLALYEQMKATVRDIAQPEGVELRTEPVADDEVDAVVPLLDRSQADLFVIDLHRPTSPISRLSNKVFEIAQNTPCSVLGVHQSSSLNTQ
jgi:nucleotide-binding universal stress UspA family protein